ncbi:unnamed protein product, partial [Rotaria sp. Silwood2]
MLKSSATEFDREQQLANNSAFNYKFDFYNAKVGVRETAAGRSISAN